MKRSTAFHPQTDGQSEVVNRRLETYPRCFCGERPKQWVQWLHWAEYWYNTTFHSSIRSTLFQIVYSRSPPPLLSYSEQKTTDDSIEE